MSVTCFFMRFLKWCNRTSSCLDTPTKVQGCYLENYIEKYPEKYLEKYLENYIEKYPESTYTMFKNEACRLQAFRPGTLLKSDSNIGFFLWILRNAGNV